jgi:hypothetical protein
MTILTVIRDRFSPSSASSSELAHDAFAGGAGDRDALPFAGYDRLDHRQIVKRLCDHSQSELAAVEGYERSHRERKPVLDKLRYMRGREPLPGYDALSVEEIVAALKEADLATIQKVRGYERKFANRAEVLEEVLRVNRRRQATQPASAAPRYQPTSGRTRSGRPSVARRGTDRP